MRVRVQVVNFKKPRLNFESKQGEEGKMDFFGAQDRARRKSTLLVVYFILAVVMIFALLYVAITFLLQYPSLSQETHAYGAANNVERPEFHFFNFPSFILAAAAMLGLVGGGSLYKSLQLRSGGKAVAEMLGGRMIHGNAKEVHERRILNVVEEMSIASGVPLPTVYVLEEPGINAFAAGNDFNDAVIGINRGTIELLTRDELQGVVAHEFSHILNGDMKTNMRMISILHGIQLLGVVGLMIVRWVGFSSAGRMSRDRDRRFEIAMIVLGFVLIVVGFSGLFFARLIKAALSRQREYLADASAVQFTRNPDGIGGALKAIGALHNGSAIKAAQAETASHMFFANVLKMDMSGMLATHPPLVKRIQAIDSDFNGDFTPVTKLLQRRIRRIKNGELAEGGKQDRREQKTGGAFPGMGMPGRGRFPFPLGGQGQSDGGMGFDPVLILGSVGTVQAEAIEQSREMIDQIPDRLRDAARDSFDARALAYCLLISDDTDAITLLLPIIEEHEGEATVRRVRELTNEVTSLQPQHRLPLMEIAQYSLAQLSKSQYEVFRGTILRLVEADKQITLFEFVLKHLLIRHLDRRFGLSGSEHVQHYSLTALRRELQSLLSVMISVSETDPEKAGQLFRTATERLHISGSDLRLLTADENPYSQIDLALQKIARSKPALRKQILQELLEIVFADQEVTQDEAELVRAVAESIDCPCPPLRVGQVASAELT